MESVARNNLKHEMKSTESELMLVLIENMIKTKSTVLKSDKIEKP